MNADCWGLDYSTTSSQAIGQYEEALVAMLESRLSVSDAVKAALTHDPMFVMGLVMRGAMLLQLSSRSVADKVSATLMELDKRAADATPRERSHVLALKAWAHGRLGEACETWKGLVQEFPSDLLALRLHHFLSFWQGDGPGLRELPVWVMRRTDEEMRGYGFVMSMAAFGAEECGAYEEAERYGRRSVEINHDDLWGIHAVAHVLEMQGRHLEGTEWLSQPLDIWSDRNPFQNHVWWHRALFLLELGLVDEVLFLFDHLVDIDERGFYLDVQNAASLLMRLKLRGIEVGGRWEKLAEAAEARVGDHVLPFTDTHFMMALTASCQFDAARRYLASQKHFADNEGGEAAEVTRDVGMAVSQALLAYGEANFSTAAELLIGVRASLTRLGASHAQRDVFQQILIDAAMRAGKTDMARDLLMERSQLLINSNWGAVRLASLG